MITRLCGGMLVLPDGCETKDLWIEGETILSLGAGPAADRRVDVSGCYVFPGAIDPHVHMGFAVGEFLSSDDFASGTLAAAFGGVTTILDFAVPEGNESISEALAKRITEATRVSCVDVGMHAVVHRSEPLLQQEIEACIQLGAPDFKTFTTYEGLRLTSPELLEVMTNVRAAGGLVMVHAEDDAGIQARQADLAARGSMSPMAHAESRPTDVERDAVREVLRLQAETDCPVHFVHISSAQSVEIIRNAQQRGRDISAETGPQYLLLDEGVYRRPEAVLFMISPPIKSRRDQGALWEGVQDRTLSMIATDHCPFTREDKMKYADYRKVPTGMPGVETTLPLMFTAWQSRGWPLEVLAQAVSTSSAKRFGLYPRKGVIAEGSDADLVIYDPSGLRAIASKDLHMNVDWSPFENAEVQGAVRDVWLRGMPLIENGGWVGGDAPGEFLDRCSRMKRV